jgi:hypothetical protein
MPLSLPQLCRTFSNYGDTYVMSAERWLYHGGEQPADEVIQQGFPVLYNHIYCTDFHGNIYWSRGYYFTETQKQRWEMMESMTGLEPIIAAYQLACNDHQLEKVQSIIQT